MKENFLWLKAVEYMKKQDRQFGSIRCVLQVRTQITELMR